MSAMSRSRSLWMSPTSWLPLSLGSGLEIFRNGPAGGGPTNRLPPADTIQSVMTIGSAI